MPLAIDRTEQRERIARIRAGLKFASYAESIRRAAAGFEDDREWERRYKHANVLREREEP